MTKTIILASFIFPERVEWFLSYLETKFSITKDKVFCYKNLDDESKLIVTFKVTIDEDKRLNIKELFPGAIPIHKKGNALYTINALNKLIDEMLGEFASTTDYKTVKIKWEEYQNKMILLNGKSVGIFSIERIF